MSCVQLPKGGSRWFSPSACAPIHLGLSVSSTGYSSGNPDLHLLYDSGGSTAVAVQQELEDLEVKVTGTKRRLDDERVRLIGMGRRNGDLHKRICAATDALLHLSRQDRLPDGTAQPPCAAGPPASAAVHMSDCATPSQHEAVSGARPVALLPCMRVHGQGTLGGC